MRIRLAVGCLAALVPASLCAADPRPMPTVPPGWKIDLVAEAPEILFPTACVVAPDGAVYLGQDPMDMPGPPTEPLDSVVVLKDGKVQVFADKLWAVMGLEWFDGTLFVVHAPFLSALTDTDGDGKADQRVDLMTGLGPKLPGFSGINDHVASGIRLGMDGYLYISVGDKGIPRGVGRDGTAIQLFGGGVIRIRPDGTGLEVVSTGERNPLSVALSANDEVFTYGNDDDSKQWPNSLTHHIVGGHYGYPYDFDHALRPKPLAGLVHPPKRYLPIMAGQLGGSGTQGVCYNEDGLPDRYRGNLFFCDWGLQTVYRFEIEPAGATYRVKSKEPFVTGADVEHFRPFSLAVSPVDGSLFLGDWAFSGWLAAGPQTGRLYHLTYIGADRKERTASPPADDVAGLDHAALSIRLAAQSRLVKSGARSVPALVKRVRDEASTAGRLHALWALNAIGGPEAQAALRACLRDANPDVRLQAVRCIGVRPKGWSAKDIVALLADQAPAVRRETAIALGRLEDPSAAAALYAALGDADSFVSWSIRRAIRACQAWDAALLLSALNDPKRRDDALALTDEVWSLAVVDALSGCLPASKDPVVRARLVSNLVGIYRRYPEWSGNWFGTNPLAGRYPAKTRNWSPEGMGRIRVTLDRALKDSAPEVRREAIAGLRGAGPSAAAGLRALLAVERDERNLVMLCEALGAIHDAGAAAPLASLLRDKTRSTAIRVAALEALSALGGRPAMNARLSVAYDPQTPVAILVPAVIELGRSQSVPANDLAEFLDHKDPAVRAATIRALTLGRAVPGGVRQKMQARLDDPDREVRTIAAGAVAATNQRNAIPKLLQMADSEDAEPAQLALAAMPDPRATKIYLRALNETNPAQRAAAETALLAIRDLAAGDLEAAVRARTLKPWAADAVERILVHAAPVLEWKVIGPFPRTTARVFVGEESIDFTKVHAGVEGKRITWQPRSAEPATGRIVLDDFKGGAGDRGGFGYDTNGSPDLCAFGYAEVTSETDRQALLLVGSSGSLQISVNGKIVYDYGSFAGRPYRPDADRVRIPLRHGVNRILIKSRQGIGTWSYSVQVSDPSTALFATQPGRVSLEDLRTFALANDGDPSRGKAIFLDPKGIGCVKCHSAEGQGTANVGPDLTGLALKYDKAEIVRSVLEPSNRIATGYQPLLIARKDGTVVTGVLRAETARDLELIDADAKLTRVSKVEIEERRVGTVSIMPTGLIDTLTPEQFADLIAYLRSLKAAAPAATTAPAVSARAR